MPSGYELVRRLAGRDGVTVVQARRGSELVVVRLDRTTGAGEGTAELAVLAAVEHPGIAALVDHGALPGGGRFLARRWIEGEDLLTWAEGKGPEDVGRAVAHLCPALDHLHRLGFVHGDLKPENVIVQADGRVFLCDFGLAVSAGASTPGEVRGTLFAIAPEVLLGSEPSAGADLFSLGALLHQLLITRRRSAREFYARFPQSSFLDAVGSRPEDLPEWARDLVVSLTAREPTRRPRSAAFVGRMLASRLGIQLDLAELSDELRWPVGFGREAWLTSWFADAQRAGKSGAPAPQWIQVPGGEDPHALWDHLRLFAALRGGSSRGVDLGQELRGIDRSGALDEWALAQARSDASRLFVCAPELGPWERRAVASLARACAQTRSRRDAGAPQLFLVTPGEMATTEIVWDFYHVPRVDRRDILHFLGSQFPAEKAPRLEELADLLDSAASGSGSRLDELLVAAASRGLVLAADDGFQLRPGPLAHIGLDGDDAEIGTEAGADILAALTIVGGRSTPTELARLLERDESELGTALLELAGERFVRLGEDEGRRVTATLRARRLAPEQARVLHARRAQLLEEEDPTDTQVLIHRFCADPSAELVRALAAALEDLRDRGCAELALDKIERALELARATGIAVEAVAPELVIECASSWCALGRTENALEILEQVEQVDTPQVSAAREIVLARIDGLREATEKALERYERAKQLDPAVAPEALIGRVHLLHASGRDREVCDELAAARPRELEQRGELRSRQRAFLESLEAMSAFRLGEVDHARSRFEELIAEARSVGDLGREAALRIYTATIERRAGSAEKARAELLRSIDLHEEAGLAAGLAHARVTLGGLLRDVGELIEAEELLVTAVESRERLGDTEGAATARGTLGLLHSERGHARAAITALTESVRALRGAHRLRFAPLLLARAAEMRVRTGQSTAGEDGEEADPRVLVSKARSSWMLGDPESALAFAERAESLATSLRATLPAREAVFLSSGIRGTWTPPANPGEPSLLSDDERLLARLEETGERFQEDATRKIAEALEKRGRDDRAARAWFALAARTQDPERAAGYEERAAHCFAACATGLTDSERTSLRQHLLGIPDPWPGDFTPRPGATVQDEEHEMDVISLLEINQRLLQQQDLETLLGTIVESALAITGAERGFLMLEERGELRFDTARDTCRGDIAQPEFEISHSVVREALDRMEPLRVSNAVDDPLLGHAPSVVTLELRSILCVPVVVSDDMRAAIYLDHRLRTGAFDDRAERLGTMLASQAALAIQQVRRIEEIRRLNKKLGRRVAEQESSLQTARRALREAGIADPIGGLLGRSAAIQHVHELLRKAAPSSLPVLIVGQSGTGKELAARSLHDLSPRRERPFVSESCAALPAPLIESELFGYRRGAFTGAERDREGLFERAEGGTLFLDEIGEMPLGLQAKLLRVLETNEVRRLGDNKTKKVDFRLVVATNRDLDDEVREGRFREDLFYRLDGVRVQMPSLAERTEDIPLLVEHFLRLDEAETGVTRQISPAVVARLSRRPWPGNVRELRNEIARLCVVSEGPLEDAALVRGPGPSRGGTPATDLVSLAELERRAIETALEHTGGDKRRAAEILGISRATIYQRLKEWAQEEK